MPISVPTSKPITTSPAQLAKAALAEQQVQDDQVQPNGNVDGAEGTVRTAAEWAQFGRDHVSHGLGRLRDHVIVKGQGLDLWTAEGKKLLDFTAGIGVTNLGHCHPAVSAAAASQVSSLVHLQCSVAFHSPYLQLIDRLLPAMPHPSLDSFFFWNSGSEAVEAALKVTRKVTKRPNVIAFQGAYHGRTYGSGALTKSKTIYTSGTGILMPGVFSTAYPYWHSLGVPQGTSEEEIVRLAIHQLDMVFRQQVAPADVGAIFIEPVQGEGGYVPCPPAFMRHLRSLCDKHGILLVVDEVQTGFFRTGEYFTLNYYPDVRPDIMVFAKGIANGFPLSGIVGSKELMDKLDPGMMGGTYAGNAVACAAGVAAQEVFQTQDIKGNVKARSEQLYASLNELAASPKTAHMIAEVRGLGLMASIEFRTPTDPLTHSTLPSSVPPSKIPKDIAKRVQKYCLDHDMLIMTTSCFDTIRFIPALVVSQEEMERGMRVFKEAVESVALEG